MKKRYLASVCAVGLLMGSQSALACGDDDADSFIGCGQKYYKLCSAAEWSKLHNGFAPKYAEAMTLAIGEVVPISPLVFGSIIQAAGDAIDDAVKGQKVTLKGPVCIALETLLDGYSIKRMQDSKGGGFTSTQELVLPNQIVRYTKPPATADGIAEVFGD